MLRLAPCLLALALLAAPAALADQDAQAGPAHVRTQNASTGDGCAEGGNGSDSRFAEARVDATPRESLVLLFQQSCSSWNQTWDDGAGGEHHDRGTSDQGTLLLARSTDGNVGPAVQAGYWDMRNDGTWGASRNCWSYAYAAGPAVSPGCSVDGSRHPMAPALP